MEKDRGGRNEEGNSDKQPHPEYKSLDDAYPDVHERIDRLLSKPSPYVEEMLHRPSIEQSPARKRFPTEILVNSAGRTVKNGAEIVVKGLRRAGEIVHLRKPTRLE